MSVCSIKMNDKIFCDRKLKNIETNLKTQWFERLGQRKRIVGIDLEV